MTSSKYDKVNITIMQNCQDVEKLRPIWTKMHHAENFTTVNADIDVYLTTVNSMTQVEKPYIVILSDNDQPISMLIGRVEKRSIPFGFGYKTLFQPQLRSLSIVHGGVLGSPDYDNSQRLIHELMKLLSNGEVDMVFFNHINYESHFYRACHKIPGFLSRDSFIAPHPHWQTHIPDNAQIFNQNLSKSRKRYLKRYSKYLSDTCKESLDILPYKHVNDIEHVNQVTTELSAQTYKNTLGVGFQNNSLMRNLIQLYAEKGWWRAYILMAGNKPCAVEYGVCYGDTFFGQHIFYDPALRECSPGTLLFIKTLEFLADEPNINKFDYGYGAAEYKERFGDYHWPEAIACIYAPRFYPLLINNLKNINSAAVLALTKVMNKYKKLSSIKQRWRRKLEKQTK